MSDQGYLISDEIENGKEFLKIMCNDLIKYYYQTLERLLMNLPGFVLRCIIE